MKIIYHVASLWFLFIELWKQFCKIYVLLAVLKPLAVLIPLQGLEMAWPFRNGQLFLLAVLIPHQFDIGGQVCSVAFKCNSCITIKTVYLLKRHLVYYETYI